MNPDAEKMIREIHVKGTVGGLYACDECFRTWPCPTIKSLTKPIAPPAEGDEPTGYAALWAWWGAKTA